MDGDVDPDPRARVNTSWRSVGERRTVPTIRKMEDIIVTTAAPREAVPRRKTAPTGSDSVTLSRERQGAETGLMLPIVR
jgi:hypothetical protein